MKAPLAGTLLITQLFASKRGGPGEAYPVWHDGVLYQCVGHAGVDFNAAIGTSVIAMRGGVLSATPHDPWHGGYAGALGLYAVITLPNGETHTYAHLSEVVLASGTTVAEGHVFARSGATGNVTGPHLHIGVRPPNPDYGSGFDGTIDFLPHFDHDVFSLLDLSLV